MQRAKRTSHILSPFLRQVPVPYSALHPLLTIYQTQALPPEPSHTEVLLNYLSRQVVLLDAATYRSLVSTDDNSDPSTYRSVLISSGLLIPPATLRCLHRYEMLEIESIRHCNYRCAYCPNHLHPKPKGTMLLKTFDALMKRCVEYGILSVSLNHYSEPSLDRLLVKRIAIAQEHGLCVALYTNASQLSTAILKAIARIGNTTLIANIPDSIPSRYAYITGSNSFGTVSANLTQASKLGIPVNISVNAPVGNAVRTLKRVSHAFSHVTDAIDLWCTDDRAGLLDVSEFISFHSAHSGMLNGCFLATANINVDWQGQVFMCAQDYYQQYRIGNLVEKPLSSIVEDKKGWLFRQYVYGLLVPPADFICRRCAWTITKPTVGTLRMGNASKLPANKHILAELLERGWRINDLTIGHTP